MTAKVKLIFFARAREIVGKQYDIIEIQSEITYKDLLDTIVQRFSLAELEKTIILALNEEYCPVSDIFHLKKGDEIAIIPPLSDTISELVASPECGAVSVFVGMTRDNFEGKGVVTLEYEVYETMAITYLKRICSDIRAKWTDVHNIAIYHRLGMVPVKEASIIIAISSPHRADAMAAVQWCIDNVKKSVPIWKKEIYKDHTESWKQNKESLPYPPKIKLFKLKEPPKVKVPFVAPHLIQIKANSEEIERRIGKYIERKRDEINQSNIRDFCSRDVGDVDEFSCARIDATLVKRKDSKGHLQGILYLVKIDNLKKNLVSRVLNTYHRDQGSFEFLRNYDINKNGIEERITNAETQLSIDNPVNKNIYKRLQVIEDRLLHLESISPEYIQFWDKTKCFQKGSNKKRIFTIDEIDSFINNLENKRAKISNRSDDDS
ncbi:hypothetical protein FQA39_LY13869 [Lamprigera yunnana]|nr:hypothetical protein FQA39_LY13869 [Lamprigera yunnana]